jgi:hypothetical protein
LTLKEENLHEKAGKEKSKKMMARINEINKPPNAWETKQDEDLPPCLLGYFPYKHMGLKANKTKLEKEVKALEISFDRRLTMTQKSKILKAKEPHRYKEQVEVKLQTRGHELMSLKLPEKI